MNGSGDLEIKQKEALFESHSSLKKAV